MAAVTFDYDTWIGTFPEFSGVTAAQGEGFFNRAGLVFDNTESNPAFGSGNMPMLMYLLTSHIAWLNAPRDGSGNPTTQGQQAPQVVGRINSASEGSVSVGSEWKGQGSPSQDWFLQTRYGAEFWTATAPYRTMRYRANPTIVYGGAYPLVNTYRGR